VDVGALSRQQPWRDVDARSLAVQCRSSCHDTDINNRLTLDGSLLGQRRVQCAGRSQPTGERIDGRVVIDLSKAISCRQQSAAEARSRRLRLVVKTGAQFLRPILGKGGAILRNQRGVVDGHRGPEFHRRKLGDQV
jgi:hypothetical protein